MNLKGPPGKHPTLLVWDAEGSPPGGDWTTVLWRNFGISDAPNVISIPKLVEDHADALRARYLDWLYEIGETLINGKRLVDHLELRPGFSYWWMTLLAEKNSLGLPRIFDAIRLLALEDLSGLHRVSRIILASSDRTLTATFRLWCRNAGMSFEWRQMKRFPYPTPCIKRLYRTLPNPLKAVIYLLRYLKQRWSLRQAGSISLAKSSAKITFCSYFDNMDACAAQQGRFFSRYWTTLPEAIIDNGFSANWIQLYVQDGLNPTAKNAKRLITSFNGKSNGVQFHTSLDSVLDWSTIVGTFCDYTRIMLMGLRLSHMRHHFKPVDSNINLWPLFKKDWHYSFYGVNAISNCLSLNLFERTLKYMPRQHLGIFLQENYGWEMAFIHVWRAAGHGHLIGVDHGITRYWNLRYLFAPLTYNHAGRNDLPMPDRVALNGPVAMAAYQRQGYPEARMVEVEALRYLYLADTVSVKKTVGDQAWTPLRVLVLGDFTPAVTHQQMQWLVDASHLLPPDTRYIIKPHPNCPVKANDYHLLNFQLTNSPLADLLGDCDVAYTSNPTGAAVDAYSVGIPVVSVLDGAVFNMSPLRGLTGVRFVTSPKELAEALSNRGIFDRTCKRTDYFTIDATLPRWRTLLLKTVNEQIL